MKKIFSLFAALVLAMGAFANSFVIAFQDTTLTSGDSSWKRTTKELICKTGADKLTSISNLSNAAYAARTGYGVKVGTSKNPGSMTLNFAGNITPDSIIVRAASYSKSEGAAMIFGDSVDLCQGTDSLNKVILPIKKVYDGNTVVSSIVLATKAKRVFFVDVTVYYTDKLAGALDGVTPAVNYSFIPEFAYNADSTITITGTLNAEAAAVPGMVPQAFINNAYAGNFTMTAATGACTYTTSAKFGNSENVTFALYMAYAGGATRSADVVYTTPAPVDTTNTVHIANTAATAYTTAEIIKLIDDKKSILADSVFVKGVVGSNNPSFNGTYKSITYYLDNNAFQIYSGRNLGNTDFAAVTDINLNDTVIVKGVVKKFNSTYEMDKNNYLVEYHAYVKPATDTTGTVNIANTQAEAYTVSEALALLADKKSILTDSVYVKGVVDSIIEVTAQYGNGTFMITDGESRIEVFRCRDLGNVKFSSDDAVKIGDKIIVKTVLAEFNGLKECAKGYLVEHKKAGYYIKHPFDGTNWEWAAMRDTVIMDYPASYYVGTWGGVGFNIAKDEDYENASWYPEDLIGYADAEGNIGDGYKPAVGDKVVFGFLHEDVATVVGGGRAWVITGVFTALDANGAEVTCTKVLIDGKVYIIRGEHMYNANGAMVK